MLLLYAKEGNDLFTCFFFNIPVHRQAVERVVEDITEASKHGCEATARDAFIRALVRRWHIQSEFKTEGQYRGTHPEVCNCAYTKLFVFVIFIKKDVQYIRKIVLFPMDVN